MKFGIMQGRLLPRPYPKLKAFPYTMWREEFTLTKNLGVFNIEWVFEADRYRENPIWTSEGREEICYLVKETGVSVPSLCADFFLKHPLHRDNDGKSLEVFKDLIQKVSEVGISLILLPVLEEAELKNDTEREQLICAVNDCVELLNEHRVRIGIETVLPAAEYLSLIREFKNDVVGAYYDTGNSACSGYDMKKDLEILYPVLFGIHIKDRPLNGPSVYIGSGDANFKEGIPFLKSQSFQGQIVFETFYEKDPVGTMHRNLEVIKGFINVKRGDA